MNKKRIIVGMLLFLLFAELQIDFAISFVDSGLVGLITFLAVIISGTTMIVSFAQKNLEKGISSAIILISVILGSFLGGKVTTVQLHKAQAYVENLAIEVNQIKKERGSYPQDLAGINRFDPSGNVPIGLIRKRPLFYSLDEKNDSYRFRFPYVFFLMAEYDGATGKWRIDD